MSRQVKAANDLGMTIKAEAVAKEKQEYANIHAYNQQKQQREFEQMFLVFLILKF